MAIWKRLTDIDKSRIEIDLDTIAFMCSNGSGTEIHFDFRADTDGERKPGSRCYAEEPGQVGPSSMTCGQRCPLLTQNGHRPKPGLPSNDADCYHSVSEPRGAE